MLTLESRLRGRRSVDGGLSGGGRGLGILHLDVFRHRGVGDEVEECVWVGVAVSPFV